MAGTDTALAGSASRSVMLCPQTIALASTATCPTGKTSKQISCYLDFPHPLRRAACHPEPAMFSRSVAYILIAILAALNAYLNIIHVREARRAAITRPPPVDHYTFIDDDYTPRMPLPSARRAVKLALEDSVRYGLWGLMARMGNARAFLLEVGRYARRGLARRCKFRVCGPERSDRV
ncbi:hypothetical protein NUW54_g1571 [Trametes sanguinea]|uniref:Uncharacterized protein n=1 Tax=Trametes sanguinea TaxID=158606 RepID=A0ACC1Q7B0_9APHY|nr:hypothetical protein NUW54_g1571 [Trametes sanguinea]